MKAEDKAKELYPTPQRSVWMDDQLWRDLKTETSIRRECFLKGVEFAQQQQEPQSSKVDVMDFILKEAKKKSGIPFTSIDKISVEWCIELMGKWAELSTNQDKVRKAAEKVVVVNHISSIRSSVQLDRAIDELEQALNQNK